MPVYEGALGKRAFGALDGEAMEGTHGYGLEGVESRGINNTEQRASLPFAQHWHPYTEVTIRSLPKRDLTAQHPSEQASMHEMPESWQEPGTAEDEGNGSNARGRVDTFAWTVDTIRYYMRAGTNVYSSRLISGCTRLACRKGGNCICWVHTCALHLKKCKPIPECPQKHCSCEICANEPQQQQFLRRMGLVMFAACATLCHDFELCLLRFICW